MLNKLTLKMFTLQYISMQLVHTYESPFERTVYLVWLRTPRQPHITKNLYIYICNAAWSQTRWSFSVKAT